MIKLQRYHSEIGKKVKKNYSKDTESASADIHSLIHLTNTMPSQPHILSEHSNDHLIWKERHNVTIDWFDSQLLIEENVDYGW